MSRTARRLGLAVAGIGFAALAGFATASPAAADNGPHSMLSGSSIANADGCAGCHRMHASLGTETVDGSMFRFASASSSEEDFCYTCHADGLGATTDVKHGVSTIATTDKDTNAMLTGATSYFNVGLRGGGFESNTIGASAAVQGNIYWAVTSRGSSWSINKYGASTYKNASNAYVSAAGVHPSATNGAYIWGDLIPSDTYTSQKASSSEHALGTASTLWGSNTTGAGQTGVSLECTSCHNPHGNGNYRILRPIGFEGSANSAYALDIFSESATVSSSTVPSVDPVNTTTSTKYMETLTLTSSATFIVGQPVILRGPGVDVSPEPNTVNYGIATVYSISGTTMVIGNSSSLKTISGAGVIVRPAFPTTIIAAYNTSGNEYEFLTAASMNLATGQKLTVSTVNKTSSAFAMKQATVTSCTAPVETVTGTSASPATFTAGCFRLTLGTLPANVGIEAGLYVEGIPDAKTVTDTTTAGTTATNPGIPVGANGRGDGKVYTTANYYVADDMYYFGSSTWNKVLPATAGTLTATPFITNVSQWCSTCHTRYLSDNRRMADTSNSDFQGTYKHRSNSGSQGSPNCIQCHVAHGTSATVTGWSAATTQVGSTNWKTPAAAMQPGGTFDDSVLLRVSNRGICLMCHNPYGVS